MTREQAKFELRHVTNVTTLMEEPKFLYAFCSTCSEYNSCELDTPNDRDCLRRSYWRNIWDALNDAQDEVMEFMVDAGCVV